MVIRVGPTQQLQFTARQLQLGHIEVCHRPVNLDVEVEHEVGLGLAHVSPQQRHVVRHEAGPRDACLQPRVPHHHLHGGLHHGAARHRDGRAAGELGEALPEHAVAEPGGHVPRHRHGGVQPRAAEQVEAGGGVGVEGEAGGGGQAAAAGDHGLHAGPAQPDVVGAGGAEVEGREAGLQHGAASGDLQLGAAALHQPRQPPRQVAVDEALAVAAGEQPEDAVVHQQRLHREPDRAGVRHLGVELGQQPLHRALQLRVGHARHPRLGEGAEVEELEEVAGLHGLHDLLRVGARPRQALQEVDLVLEELAHRLDHLHLGLDDLADAAEDLLEHAAELVAVGVDVHEEPHLGRQDLVQLQLLDPL